MSKVEIKVQFETITPLWTGDAWMENNEIRPSSLIGSLRFWFEVICYFGGVCKKKEFNPNQGRFEKEVNYKEFKIKLLEHGNNFDVQVKTLSDLEIDALKKLGIPIPSIVFGTTGWKSLIEIREINFDKANFNDIEVKNRKIIPNKNWFWKGREYNGNFEVVFRVPEEIKETIFFPLLNFMDRYGYWGGSWNIGYGRLKVLSVNSSENGWRKDKFDFSKFKSSKEDLEGNWDGNFNSLISIVNYNGLINKNIDENIDKMFNIILSEKGKIIQIHIEKCNKINFKENIKTLIEIKVKLRKKYKLNAQNDKRRHEIFGYSDPTEGSKILPYINRLDNSYECGFLSIAGILSLY